MKINKLFNEIGYNNIFPDNHKVEDIFNNSKNCIAGCIFVCIKGNVFDGHDYINDAIKSGAKTIIFQNNIKDCYENINYLKVDDTRKIYALLLKTFYEEVTKDINLIGITGTNGKTTTTSIIHSFLNFNNINSVYIGTHFIKYLNCSYNTLNTTPDIKVIYDHLKIAKNHKIRYVIMEVSSIAISELRVLGLEFSVFGVTNITTDHLDYHKTLDHYLFTKLLAIFNLKKDGSLILNKDCQKSFKIFDKYHLRKSVTYSLDDKLADIYINQVHRSLKGVSFNLNQNDLRSRLIGDYNLYNIMCAYGVLKALGFKTRAFKAFLSSYEGVKGRTTVIVNEDKNIIIDYAHTEIAVSNVLKMIRQLNYKKITCVIGCGGDRDKTKRRPIGRLLNKYVDKIILTNDNPRTEDELAIINDIASGIDKEYIIIPNRYNAIKEALLNAHSDEVICILGKGDEMFQVFKDSVIEFNDTQVVNDILEKANA